MATPPPLWATGNCLPLYPRNSVPGAPGVEIGINRIVVSPRVSGQPHADHDADYITVIAGRGTISIAGRPDAQVRPQSTVMVPPGVAHYLTNTGDGSQLTYISVHVGKPRGTPASKGSAPHGCPQF